MISYYGLKKALIGAFFIAFISVPQAAQECSANLSKVELKELKQGKVKRVVDGDTLHLESGEKFRLLHIDAPEINYRNARFNEPGAVEAKALLSQFLPEGKPVYYRFDQNQQDKYKRDLVFVYNQQGQWVNAHLVLEGKASVFVIPPNVASVECFIKWQQQARTEKKGIWSFKSSEPVKASDLSDQSFIGLITGKVTEIKESRRYLWITLDNRLKVGIPHKNKMYFSGEQLNWNVGQKMTVNGAVYQAYGELLFKLLHPAGIIEQAK